jgi:zinc protease
MYPKENSIKICSGAGGTNNAYTTYDHTAYYMTLPANKLELGLWLESDRMNGFSISQKSP